MANTQIVLPDQVVQAIREESEKIGSPISSDDAQKFYDSMTIGERKRAANFLRFDRSVAFLDLLFTVRQRNRPSG